MSNKYIYKATFTRLLEYDTVEAENKKANKKMYCSYFDSSKKAQKQIKFFKVHSILDLLHILENEDFEQDNSDDDNKDKKLKNFTKSIKICFQWQREKNNNILKKESVYALMQHDHSEIDWLLDYILQACPDLNYIYKVRKILLNKQSTPIFF